MDGIGEEAQLSQPNGIVFNSNDNCLYICDIKNNMIRKMNHYGTTIFLCHLFINNLMIGEVSSFSGVPLPCAIAFNQVQNQFYVACGNHTIYKVSSAGLYCLLFRLFLTLHYRTFTFVCWSKWKGRQC